MNVPDLKQILAINRTTKELTRWPVTAGQNFPMALDEADHRVIVGTSEPATLSAFDTGTGKMVASVPTVQDTDDLYYSAEHKRVYVPGRAGEIWVYQQADPDHYNVIAKIPTVVGAGTAGYFGRQGEGLRPLLPCRLRKLHHQRRSQHLYDAGLKGAVQSGMRPEEISSLS